jgi:hypothetical protein
VISAPSQRRRQTELYARAEPDVGDSCDSRGAGHDAADDGAVRVDVTFDVDRGPQGVGIRVDVSSRAPETKRDGAGICRRASPLGFFRNFENSGRIPVAPGEFWEGLLCRDGALPAATEAFTSRDGIVEIPAGIRSAFRRRNLLFSDQLRKDS